MKKGHELRTRGRHFGFSATVSDVNPACFGIPNP